MRRVLFMFILLSILLVFACTNETSTTYQLTSEPSPTETSDAMFDSDINPGLPTVGVKKDGWSASGTLFAPTAVPPAVGRGEVSLQCDFPEAGNYTLEFSVNTPSNFAANQVNQAVVAEILWSVEGNFVSRKVTIANGTSVTGVGQAVKVRILDASQGVVGIDPPGSVFSYVVSVQVSRGSRATGGSPPTFCPIDSQELSGAATAGTVIGQVDIPENSGVNAVLVLGRRITGANTLPLVAGSIIIHQSNPNGDRAVYDYLDQAGTFIPIVPGTTRIDIIAGTTVALSEYRVTVIFAIDG